MKKKSDSLLNMTLNYDFEALKMAEESEDKNRMAIQLVNIGVAYNEKGTYPKAFDYFFRALKIEKDLGDKNSMAATLGTLGLLYSETKQFSEAEKYLTDAQKLNKEIGALKQQMDVENYLSGLYTQTKRFNLALDHYKKYIAVRDSITNDENIKKQTRLEMQFDFDKKTTTDSIRNAAQVRQERLKHDQEIKQQKIYAYGGAVGFLLMIIVAGVSFRAYRQKQKANEMISHQKSLVEEKQKEILDSIHYAQRIQRSLLPSEKYIARNLNRLKK